MDIRNRCSPGGTRPSWGGLAKYLQAVLDTRSWSVSLKIRSGLSGDVFRCSDELLACFTTVMKSGVFRKTHLDFCVDVALFVLGYSRMAEFETGGAALSEAPRVANTQLLAK